MIHQTTYLYLEYNSLLFYNFKIHLLDNTMIFHIAKNCNRKAMKLPPCHWWIILMWALHMSRGTNKIRLKGGKEEEIKEETLYM